MAVTPAKLVDAVADVLGLPPSLVRNYDRRLMEAGLRTKKGHGRGSALMGPKDAAALLAAIGGSDEVLRAPECVRSLYSLPYYPHRVNEEAQTEADAEYVHLSLLCDITGADEKAVATFGKALVAVMQYVVSSPPNERVFGKLRHNYGFGIEVSIAGGLPWAADLLIFRRKTRRIHFYRKEEIGIGALRVTRRIHSIEDVADVIAGRTLDGGQP